MDLLNYNTHSTSISDLKHALEEAWSNRLPETHDQPIFKELESKPSLADFDYLPDLEYDFDPLWWLHQDKPLRH